MYTVKQVAALTGVAASTLRAWERRYGVVSPDRSPGRYRLYTNEDIARLRTMAALTNAGTPAAQAAAAVEAAVRPKAPGHLDTAPDGRNWHQVIGDLDTAALCALVDRGVGRDPEHAGDWIAGALASVGSAVAAGDLTIAEHQFCLQTADGWLQQWGRDAVVPENAPQVVVVEAPGAARDIALLAIASCLRHRGVDAVYLGPGLPTGGWDALAKRSRLMGLVTSTHAARPASKITAVAESMHSVLPPIPIFVSGRLVPGTAALSESIGEAVDQVLVALVSGALG